ncbi:YciI family protein [Bacillus sp. EB01]|uniref:YciI family protein n=1 Tax=Bacillus sp. EB01 TaxID=1347086 RepID=UPI0005C76E20|nr:YciI family protein [Bacillus sp. EB01]
MKKYLVFIERKPSFTGNLIPGHREFLGKLKESERLLTAGAFEDHTGGAYVLSAESLEEARETVSKDPMNDESEATYKIREWNAN